MYIHVSHATATNYCPTPHHDLRVLCHPSHDRLLQPCGSRWANIIIAYYIRDCYEGYPWLRQTKGMVEPNSRRTSSMRFIPSTSMGSTAERSICPFRSFGISADLQRTFISTPRESCERTLSNDITTDSCGRGIGPLRRATAVRASMLLIGRPFRHMEES